MTLCANAIPGKTLILEIYIQKLSTNQIARFFKLLYVLNRFQGGHSIFNSKFQNISSTFPEHSVVFQEPLSVKMLLIKNRFGGSTYSTNAIKIRYYILDHQGARGNVKTSFQITVECPKTTTQIFLL